MFLNRFKDVNATVFFIMVYMASCSFNFGYDVGIFSGLQGMESFGKKFGRFDEQLGRHSLSATLLAVMNSVPFAGKALGAVACGHIAERWGRKMAILMLIILSFIGAVLQISATTAAQFTLGRVFSFAMTGCTIVVVPIYQAETSPKSIRGMMGSTLQLMIAAGSLVASLIVYGTQNMTSDAGWQIPTGVQFVLPALLSVLYPLVPESPRWLLSQGRVTEARACLEKIRRANGAPIDAELEQLGDSEANTTKGSWAEVFNTSNRIRTGVAILVMFGQQITGQAFVSKYSVIFYQQQGFADDAFLLNVINGVIGLICVAVTWLLVDGVGRRPLLISGSVVMASALTIVGAISTVPSPTQHARRAMVASVMTFGASFSLSWAPIAYVVVSEAARSSVKEKTNLLASFISVVTTFVVSFSIPYMLSTEYAGLGGKVGFVFGSICWVASLVAFFYIPELKDRSLEEVDYLFESGASLRKFGSIHIPRADIQEDRQDSKDSVVHQE